MPDCRHVASAKGSVPISAHRVSACPVAGRCSSNMSGRQWIIGRETPGNILRIFERGHVNELRDRLDARGWI